MITRTTLVLFMRESELLLSEKKSGFGKGKLNGAGGKIEPGESVHAAAAREAYEEFSLRVRPEDLTLAAKQKFYFKNGTQWHNATFIVRTWEGEPKESAEMGEPQWFSTSALPFDRMWSDDRYWLPRVLAGERLSYEFWFTNDSAIERWDSKPL